MSDVKPITILMAEDDLDDCMLTQEALSEACLANALHCVHNGKS